jgi:hypothetical protein
MISSKETPSTRDILKDEFLNFNCYQFSRGIKAGRPASSREVSAEQCVCTRDTSKICDPSQLYSLCFFETSDEQEAENQKRLSRSALDCGDSSRWRTSVHPTQGPTAKGGDWAVFETSLHEGLAETFELPVDKRSRPKVGPPGADPIVVELRAMRAQLFRSRFWPGVAIIAVGVLIALWIANL